MTTKKLRLLLPIQINKGWSSEKWAKDKIFTREKYQ
jgi:hypothetical protein